MAQRKLLLLLRRVFGQGKMSTKRSGRPNEGELFIGLKTTTTKYLSCRVYGHGSKLNKLVQAQRNLFVLHSATELASRANRNNNNSSNGDELNFVRGHRMQARSFLLKRRRWPWNDSLSDPDAEKWRAQKDKTTVPRNYVCASLTLTGQT